MKTAISLPDDIYEQAEKLARHMKKSRSALYRDALAEYLARHDVDAVTAALDRVADTVGTCSDRIVKAAAKRTLARTEW